MTGDARAKHVSFAEEVKPQLHTRESHTCSTSGENITRRRPHTAPYRPTYRKLGSSEFSVGSEFSNKIILFFPFSVSLRLTFQASGAWKAKEDERYMFPKPVDLLKKKLEEEKKQLIMDSAARVVTKHRQFVSVVLS